MRSLFLMYYDLSFCHFCVGKYDLKGLTDTILPGYSFIRHLFSPKYIISYQNFNTL